MSLLKDALLLVKISRPITWPLGILLVLTGFYVSGSVLSIIVFANIVVFSILYLLVVFGLNDVYDYETDRLNPRKKLVEGLVLDKRKHFFVKVSVAVASVVLLALSLANGNLTNLAGVSLGLLIAYLYSVPPIRLKGKPLLDSLSNPFFVIAFLIFGFSYGGLLTMFPAKLLYASLGVASIHAFGTILDYSADKSAKVNTIATKFGKRFAAAFSVFLLTIIILFSGIESFILKSIIVVLMFGGFFLIINPSENHVRKFRYFIYLAGVSALALFLYQQFYK